MTLRLLQHLVTEIAGTLPEARRPALAGRACCTRRRRSAACPADVALALLDEHEGFDRGWYAGPDRLAGRRRRRRALVALRCGIVDHTRATLFAGCGIVADSDPDAEWEESRIKLRAVDARRAGHRRGDEP